MSKVHDYIKDGIDQADLPKPMVEIDRVEQLAFMAGQKGAYEFMKEYWTRFLFYTGSIAGYIFGLISLIKWIVV